MKNSYLDLIDQTYRFPQEGFKLEKDYLRFHGIDLKGLIEKYGTPFRLTFLPKIGKQIEKARNMFNSAIMKHDYDGSYHFCYCTKSNHFSHVVGTALNHGVHIETSSSFDIDLILSLHKEGKIDKNRVVINNGYKTDAYLKKIVDLIDLGFSNVMVVLDSKQELNRLIRFSEKRPVKIGVRMAINEAPQSPYYTSRMGIRQEEMLAFYREVITTHGYLELKMLHFFVDSGMKDTQYYWGEFQRALQLYVDLKKECESLDSFNLGGGFPIRNNLGFEYDYEHIVDEIISNILRVCKDEKIKEPDLFTEFGKFTVGESGAIIFEVLEQKQQNDQENWYIINNSLMNTIPDAWSIHEKFILLPLNKWNHAYGRVNIGGISCDHNDYYNSEDLNQEVLLPKFENNDSEPLYLGFFHTGAYQDAISGYGGIKHCLIPSPKQVVVDIDENGNLVDYLYRNEQTASGMFKFLGYK